MLATKADTSGDINRLLRKGFPRHKDLTTIAKMSVKDVVNLHWALLEAFEPGDDDEN